MKHHFRAAMVFGLVLLPSDSETMRAGWGGVSAAETVRLGVSRGAFAAARE
jgi:hypothetical protein